MSPEQMLAQAMMPQGMGQNPNPQQPQPPPALWQRLMALLQGQQQPPQDPANQYVPPEMLPPEAVEVQRRKQQLLDAMGAE